MTVLAEDLLAENGGKIEAGFLFPGVSEADVLSRLTGYLAEAGAYAVLVGSEDDAAKAFAYYSALTAAVTRMAARPATQTVQGEVSRTYTGEQLRTLQLQANDWWATFESFWPPVTEADELEVWPVHTSARR